MKKFLAAVLIAGSLFSMPVANAEKQKVERVAQEQAGVYISSYSETKDFELVKDEVISIACGILSVIDVKYDVKLTAS